MWPRALELFGGVASGMLLRRAEETESRKWRMDPAERRETRLEWQRLVFARYWSVSAFTPMKLGADKLEGKACLRSDTRGGCTTGSTGSRHVMKTAWCGRWSGASSG